METKIQDKMNVWKASFLVENVIWRDYIFNIFLFFGNILETWNFLENNKSEFPK